MTDISRRRFVSATAAGLALAACGGPPPPATLAVTATGGSGINPGPDGSDRPLTISVIQMRGASAFDSADVFALQDPATALGSDFIKADQIVLVPGAPAAKTIGVEDGAAVIGFVGGYRDPTGKSFRAKIAAPQSGEMAVTISATPAGISVAPA